MISHFQGATATLAALRSSPQGRGPACLPATDDDANRILPPGVAWVVSAAAAGHEPERKAETIPKGVSQAVRGPLHFSRLANWT
jgi:hypothetical protein